MASIGAYVEDVLLRLIRHYINSKVICQRLSDSCHMEMSNCSLISLSQHVFHTFCCLLRESTRTQVKHNIQHILPVSRPSPSVVQCHPCWRSKSQCEHVERQPLHTRTNTACSMSERPPRRVSATAHHAPAKPRQCMSCQKM
jgi:hypothetical protein